MLIEVSKTKTIFIVENYNPILLMHHHILIRWLKN